MIDDGGGVIFMRMILMMRVRVWQESCLKHLDWQIRQIIQTGAWVILTCRSKWGAGAAYTTNPNGDVFHNR